MPTPSSAPAGRPKHGGVFKFGGNLVLGRAILTVGFWLANVARNAIQRADTTRSESLAGIARVAMLGLVIAMDGVFSLGAESAMGAAYEIARQK